MDKLSVRFLKVEDMMTENVLSVDLQVLVKDAILMLLQNRISGIPVVDEHKKLLSIVTEADLMKFAAMGGLEKALTSFRDKMISTDRLITVKKGDPFSEVFKNLLLHPVRRIVVVDDFGHLQGVVSRSDVLKAFMRSEGYSAV